MYSVRRRLHKDNSEKNIFENVYSVHCITAFKLIHFVYRSRLNEYGNTCSLVSVGRGLTQAKIKITC